MKGGIRQRSPGTWELNIYLGRDPQGKAQRKWVTVRGTKAQAQRRLRELLVDLDRGIQPPERILLKDWLDRWMADHIIPNRRQATRERYEGIIRRYLKPNLGNLELGKVTPLQVQDMETKLLAEGMAPKSVGMVHNVLSGAYRQAMRLELIGRNPVSLVSPPTVHNKEAEAPPVEAVAEMLTFAANEGHPLFTCIYLLAYTGMRRGEALALTWDAVDLEYGNLVVRASLGRRLTGLEVSSPKTAASERKIDLGPQTVKVLRRHQEEQWRLRTEVGPAYRDNDLVFCDELGGWLNPMKVTRAVKSLGRRVGEPNLTIRSLRHFHASVTLQQGTNLVVVSKRLGHANVSITSNIYAHSLPGWQKQAAVDFEEAMMDADQGIIETDVA